MTVLDLSRRVRNMRLFVGAVTVAAVVLTALMVRAERGSWQAEADWIIFGIFGVLLFLAETKPSFTMKFGDNGAISPGWTFAYALVLFGMPLGALVVLLVANLVVGLPERKPVRILVFNLSVLAGSLSAGVLVLHAFGMRGAMTRLDTISLASGLGIFLGACTMLIVNGLLIAIAIELHTGTGFITILRSGLALTVTADGALLSLAPVFVIAIDFSLVLVPLLASTSYVVIQSARKSLQRAHDASHDPLTDLLNRRAFNDRLSRAVGLTEGENEAVVLVMDFDRFKDINDSLGHAVGDSLLIAFARRLTDGLPATASAARLGGDEFAVLIPGGRTHEESHQAIEELHGALIRPYDIDGFPLTMSVSIGVATAPIDGTNVDDLLAAADLAMYQAKQFDAGVEYHTASFETDGEHRAPGRIGLLSELSKAIERGELVNHYQPQVSIETVEIDTIEALVRWQHPEHGLIRPNDFIGIAEQTDLIDALTEDVLRRAMRDGLSVERPDVVVAVNVSAQSLHKRTFAAMVLNAADDIGFPVDRLELEITERAMTTNPAWMSLTIDRLRHAGIRIAIDDFGTGYSSFASLRQIPADRLKIDRSFTKHLATSPEDRLVVRTITDLAHGLGLGVVAEGVESCEIWESIKGLGCEYAQGYAIARPMTIEQLLTTVSQPLTGDRLVMTA